ncbi:hypothetical protein [Paraburkholderia sp. J94]|uniref:immunity protein Imm33 domain-containing protein n=1 Tax=Paraburkholderia sp. J94 TaxID=2805441 RepID=UPI002AAFC682|nr:hypothetical protein [Paraburkholderia sp. J94]
MPEITSDLYGTFQHPEIVVTMPSGLEFGATNILSYFEDEVRRGTVFKAGETVQVGWMLLMLKENEAGELEVWEPRFSEIPIVWERGAKRTYRQLIVQKSVAEELEVEPRFPSLDQSAVVLPDFMTSVNFQMLRESPAGTDSGWLFTTEENESENGRLISLFEAACKRPEIIPFLALPPDSSVTRKNGNVEVSLGDRTIRSESNEFLRRLETSDLIA